MMTQTQIKPLSAEEELKKTFNIFDIDGNGFISPDEIKKTMEHLGEKLTDEEVNDMVKAADKNGDGKIDIHGKLSLFFFSAFDALRVINLILFILEFSGLLGGASNLKQAK